MKSFKQMVSEVAKPISPDEQRFIDQHTYEVKQHPVALDHQFTGDIAGKTSGKAAEPDATKYDAAYAKKEPAVETIGEETEEVELSEDPSQEKPMMMGALRAMSHNMMGIAKYVQSTNDPEEWFQNKLAGVAKEMQTLYSYATAETMTGMATEETVVENKPASIMKKLAKASASSEKGKKAVTLKKAPWEKKEETELTDEELSAKQKKIDRNKNGKIDGHDLAMLRKKKNEEVALDEAVKQGNMKLRDGSSVKVSKQDAGLINQMMNDLNSVNRRKMEKVMMNDKAGFEEIVGFAREAL